MCGIIGNTLGNKTVLKKGTTLLGHRGPDHEGFYADGPVVLGHRRLSIIDLSDISHQPMVSDKGAYAIVFNGEIYNFAELRLDLERHGSVFKSHGDTEVILQGYMQEGTAFFSKLRGMWALAIYDRKASRVVLSRDYFGIKPLYFGTKDGGLFFASELRALRAMGLGTQLNTAAYYQYFNLGYFIAPHTPYADIYKLRPREVLIWDLKTKTATQSFLPPIVPAIKDRITNHDQAVETIDVALRGSIEAHFIADTPVGLLLSGGNDSSLIAALAKGLGKNPVAYHLRVAGSTDTHYADLVASTLGLSYESVEMTQAMLEEHYGNLATLLDEPTGDTSIVPTSLIYSKIKKNTKVVLSGEGGDELFGGYLRHEELRHHHRILPTSLWQRGYDSLQGSSALAIAALNPILGKIRTALLTRGFPDDLIWDYLRSVKIADFPINSAKIRRDLAELWEAERATEPLPPLFFDLALYLPNNLMYKGDIASMTSSIESRVPFLDKNFVGQVSSLDPHFRLSSDYRSKRILKEVLARYVPRELVYRDKKGFGFGLTAYNKSIFLADYVLAAKFHREHAQLFGIDTRLRAFLAEANGDLVLTKYPRFAFALITNWKLLA